MGKTVNQALIPKDLVNLANGSTTNTANNASINGASNITLNPSLSPNQNGYNTVVNGGSPYASLTNDEKAQRVSGRSSAIASAKADESASGAVSSGVGAITNGILSGTNASGLTSAGVNGLANGIDKLTEATTSEVPSTDSSTYQALYQQYLNSTLADYQAAQEAQAAALQKNYDAAISRLKDAYNTSAQGLKKDSDEALRQAYISYMLGQRNVDQQLSNMGVSGGATESILANLYNSYGNRRNDIRNELGSNLANLAAKYNESVAGLGSNLNSNYADVLSNYYKNAASAKSTYGSQLLSQLGKQIESGNLGTDGTTHNVSKSNAVSILKNFATKPQYAAEYIKNSLGDYSEQEVREMAYEAGIPYSTITQAMADKEYEDKYGSLTMDSNDLTNYSNLLRQLKAAASVEGDDVYLTAMDKIKAQNPGMTDADMQAIIAAAGLQ